MILFLVESLDPAQFQPYAGALIGSGELVERAAPYCRATRHFRFRNALDPGGFLRLVRFIRQHEIDLVQTYGLRADTVGRLAARLGGASVVFSSIRSIDPWRKPHHTMLDRLTSSMVDLWVANSQAGRQATVTREKYPVGRIEVVYSGLSAREIPVAQRSELRLKYGLGPEDYPVIGVLANLRDMKGHCDIIKALPGIRDKLPRAIFLFAGRDDSEGRIAQLAVQYAVADSIRFLGYVRETHELLAIMDVFMLPSHWEGLPASVLEAMHAGLPIITTRVGGIPELVRDHQEALLIEPSDPAAIEHAVTAMTEDSELRDRLSTAAHSRAISEFSSAHMADRMQHLYLQWLNRKAKRPRHAQ